MMMMIIIITLQNKCKHGRAVTIYLLASLSPWSSELISKPVHVGSVVNIAPLGQAFLPVLRLSAVRVLPTLFHTFSSIADTV